MHCIPQIQEGTGGAAQQHFNVGKYNKFKLMLPPVELQNEFVGFIKQVDKSKFAVQKSLDEAQLLFDSLMQELSHLINNVYDFFFHIGILSLIPTSLPP